ncbi:hypothetical protein JNUCC64_01505 [Streptomyces sp. JNUCC 64]
MRKHIAAVALATALGAAALAAPAATASAAPDTAKAPAVSESVTRAPASGKLVGQLSYLAPGKIVVDPGNGRTPRILLLSTTTKVIDSLGVICDGGRQLPYRCTPAQLERTLKKDRYTVWATVTFTRGVVDRVVGLVEH